MGYTLTTTCGKKITRECKKLNLDSRNKMVDALTGSTTKNLGEYIEIKSVVFKD